MVCDEGVVCSDAYCIGRPEYDWFEIRDWQMRPIEDELRSRVEELELAVACEEMDKQHAVGKLNAELARLREQVRWRKYPEEKPSENTFYPVLVKVHKKLCRSWAWFENGKWETCTDVKYWIPNLSMPLPQPPEEVNHE